MLFNSYSFIFLFLPLVLFIYHFLGRGAEGERAKLWLVIASLFFYGWWNPKYLILITASILVNFFLGRKLFVSKSKLLLSCGVFFNLGLIAYFKYFNFLTLNLNFILNQNFETMDIVLPIAISFFTFQQISYLVDAYQGKVEAFTLLEYFLFVTFFPQLIAGPIVHHHELIPQFKEKLNRQLQSKNISIGFTFLMIGMFKKVVLADEISFYADPVFQAAEREVSLTFFEAWGGALAYSLQLYFDFSGYSDMAIGLARMFGIVLPINFYSPYKARSVIEFWRRWHISLSTFLKNYLYIGLLGGNKSGTSKKMLNLMITMLLAGLWHGASYTFVLWGALHGLFLCMNHVYRFFVKKESEQFLIVIGKRTLTFLCIVIAWVIFRAESFTGLEFMYKAMFAYNGLVFPESWNFLTSAFVDQMGIEFGNIYQNHVFRYDGWRVIFILLVIVNFMPNLIDLFKDESPVLEVPVFKQKNLISFQWKFNLKYAILLSLFTLMSLLYIPKGGAFLYFNF